ncbi:MAG: DUF6477 family protein [Pseudomonadota bacterium]
MINRFPLAGQRRPRILLRAARLAQKKYNRNRMLLRWLLCGPTLSNEEALRDFSEMEGEMNELRLSGSFEYRVDQHVELLAAVLYESSMLQNHPNASGSEALRVAI